MRLWRVLMFAWLAMEGVERGSDASEREARAGMEVVVVRGGEAVPLERHAARELARYVGLITGKRPAVVEEAHSAVQWARRVLLVGETEWGQLLASVPDNLGRDGFILQSAPSGRRQCLVLRGTSPIGTLYAVYHYLERFCGVGFFWDGDQVPAAPSVPLEGIDVTETPNFRTARLPTRLTTTP